jgi:triacylglycerol esterase/lipase EstA (alpha/beta hydrolase family)
MHPSHLGGRLLVGAAAALAACLGTAVSAAPAQAAANLPVVYSVVPAGVATLAHPGAAPPGANDWSCHTSAAHPRPVVLVHGTFANMTDNWNTLSPLLKNNGYCVFAFNYGGLIAGQVGGTGDIPASAAQLGAFVDRVLAATGVSQVDMVGHSQGGMLPRWYLKFLGGGAKTHALVGLSPSSHGTTLDGLGQLATTFPWFGDLVSAACQACTQQLNTSGVISALSAGGDTVPGVAYTVIQTRFDLVVTPWQSAFLSGPNVTNIVLQDQCWNDFGDHVSMAFDHVALRDVLNALDPGHARAPDCTWPVWPGTGG